MRTKINEKNHKNQEKEQERKKIGIDAARVENGWQVGEKCGNMGKVTGQSF